MRHLTSGYKPFRGLLCLPGGQHERRETPKEVAIRETREETGIVVDPQFVECVRISHSNPTHYFKYNMSNGIRVVRATHAAESSGVYQWMAYHRIDLKRYNVDQRSQPVIHGHFWIYSRDLDQLGRDHPKIFMGGVLAVVNQIHGTPIQQKHIKANAFMALYV